MQRRNHNKEDEKKINVPPGQSVTTDFILNQQPSTSGTSKKNQNRKGHYNLSDEDTVSSKEEDKYSSEEETEENEDTEANEETEENEETETRLETTVPKMNDINIGDFVMVKFTTLRNNIKKFIGEVLEKSEQGLQVKFLKESSSMKNCYIFPNRDDIEIVSEDQVERKMQIISNTRGNIRFL